MVKFRAYYLCLIFHNKTCGGDRDFWGQVTDSNDSKIITGHTMLGFLWGRIQFNTF